MQSTGGILIDKNSKANISDTQTATFDFGNLQVLWQHRTWGQTPDPKYPWGATFYGDKGTLKASVMSYDFTPFGGMDMANFALASYLARTGNDVHLVCHRASPELATLGGVRTHAVARPLGIHRLGEPLLRSTARRVHRDLTPRGCRAVANGGNADLHDVNWVHYVHAAFDPPAFGVTNRLRVASNQRRYVAEDRATLGNARLVVCNSNRTADNVVNLAGVARDRTRVVYYGIDPVRFGRVGEGERAAVPEARRVALARARRGGGGCGRAEEDGQLRRQGASNWPHRRCGSGSRPR